MSRSGYNEDNDGDNWSFICYRGAVTSAIKGARGQALLRELITGLDAMPNKRLVAGELQAEGSFCALGVVGNSRGLDLAAIDTYDVESLGPKFNIAESLAREVMWINDEHVRESRNVQVEIFGPLRPWEPRTSWATVTNENAGAQRWQEVRDWAARNLVEAVGSPVKQQEGA